MSHTIFLTYNIYYSLIGEDSVLFMYESVSETSYTYIIAPMGRLLPVPVVGVFWLNASSLQSLTNPHPRHPTPLPTDK
jgi:hypothetical protein